MLNTGGLTDLKWECWFFPSLTSASLDVSTTQPLIVSGEKGISEISLTASTIPSQASINNVSAIVSVFLAFTIGSVALQLNYSFNFSKHIGPTIAVIPTTDENNWRLTNECFVEKSRYSSISLVVVIVAFLSFSEIQKLHTLGLSMFYHCTQKKSIRIFYPCFSVSMRSLLALVKVHSKQGKECVNLGKIN